MTSSNGKFCSQCGYKNCPHEGGQPADSTVAMVLPVERYNYDPYSDHSLDHKSNVLQLQAIHFAMMRYFGGGSTAKSLLCQDWLAARGPLEPMPSLGNYLAYRNRYNFTDME